MSYSVDLRMRVLNFIENGGSIVKAAQLYGVALATIYRWRHREDINPTKVKRRKRKLDWEALKRDVEANPEATLLERAKKFGVRQNAIFYALKQLKITRKKTITLSRKEKRRKDKIFSKIERIN
jgi:putative transposase